LGGECIRCVGNNLHCERASPLRPKGANPKQSRVALTAADHDLTPHKPRTHPKYPLRQASPEPGAPSPSSSAGPALAAHLLQSVNDEIASQTSIGHLGWAPYSPAPALPPSVPPTRPPTQAPLGGGPSELSLFAAARHPTPPSQSPAGPADPAGHWNDYLLDFFEPRAEPNADRQQQPVADLSTWFNLDMLVPFDDPPDTRTPPNTDTAGSSALVLATATHADPAAPPQELPSDIIAIYSSLNDDLLRSLPRPAAELLSRQWNSLASSTELGRAAAMALCMLQYLRLPENRNHEAQVRILAQSNTYFERAVTHLADGQIPLEAQLNAVIDMHYHQVSRRAQFCLDLATSADQIAMPVLMQLDVAGAGPAYAMLLIGEVFVTQAMGDKPVLDLAKAAGFHSSSIRLFACTFVEGGGIAPPHVTLVTSTDLHFRSTLASPADIDTFRTLCLGGRRTVVTYHGLSGLFAAEGAADAVPETEAFRLNELHGLPVVFLVCFAETSNLAVDAAALGREAVLARAGRIEHAILGWKPSSPAGPLKDSVAYINNLATQEMVSTLGCTGSCCLG